MHDLQIVQLLKQILLMKMKIVLYDATKPNLSIRASQPIV